MSVDTLYPDRRTDPVPGSNTWALRAGVSLLLAVSGIVTFYQLSLGSAYLQIVRAQTSLSNAIMLFPDRAHMVAGQGTAFQNPPIPISSCVNVSSSLQCTVPDTRAMTSGRPFGFAGISGAGFTDGVHLVTILSGTVFSVNDVTASGRYTTSNANAILADGSILDRALASAPPGSSPFIVVPGGYSESASVPHVPPSGSTIECASGASFTNSKTAVFSFSGTGQSVTGPCAISGSATELCAGRRACAINITGAVNLTLDGVKVSHSAGDAILSTKGCTNCTFRNSTLAAVDGAPLNVLDNATNLHIQDNNLTNTNSGTPANHKAVQVHGNTPGSVVDGIFVDRNSIAGGNYAGIEIGYFGSYPAAHMKNVHIDDNTWVPASGYTAGSYGIVSITQCYGCVVHHNIQDTRGSVPILTAAFEVVSSNGVLLDHNIWRNPVSGSIVPAVSVDTAENVTVDSNQTAGYLAVYGGSGSFPSGPGEGGPVSNVTVKGNTVVTQGKIVGINIQCNYTGSSVSNVRVEGNIFIGAASPAFGANIENDFCPVYDSVRFEGNIFSGFAVGMHSGSGRGMSITNLAYSGNHYFNISDSPYVDNGGAGKSAPSVKADVDQPWTVDGKPVASATPGAPVEPTSGFCTGANRRVTGVTVSGGAVTVNCGS